MNEWLKKNEYVQIYKNDIKSYFFLNRNNNNANVKPVADASLLSDGRLFVYLSKRIKYVCDSSANATK